MQSLNPSSRRWEPGAGMACPGLAKFLLIPKDLLEKAQSGMFIVECVRADINIDINVLKVNQYFRGNGMWGFGSGVFIPTQRGSFAALSLQEGN